MYLDLKTFNSCIEICQKKKKLNISSSIILVIAKNTVQQIYSCPVSHNAITFCVSG